MSGPLDITTAARCADRVEVASRGGVRPLNLDLTGVDALSSFWRHRTAWPPRFWIWSSPSTNTATDADQLR